jgi:hypothetical protein
VYSIQPPKESLFVFRDEEPDEDIAFPATLPSGDSHLQGVSNTELVALSTTTSGLSSIAGQSSCNVSNDSFTSQVATLVASKSIDIEAVCRRYFQTFHRWFSFISAEEFWFYYFSPERGADPEFSALLLSMYLIVCIPTGDRLDSTGQEVEERVYSITRGFWQQRQNASQPSIFLIQAGLLLATYENGQALEETSRSSIDACVRMAYAMRLHITVRQNALFDSDAQVFLDTQRRLWWAIVMLERCGAKLYDTNFIRWNQLLQKQLTRIRLLFVKNVENGYAFASQHPALDDYLPTISDTTSHQTSDLMPVGILTEADSEFSGIEFADVHPYPALAQATYLLNCVSDHIRNCPTGAYSLKEAAFLDRSLQSFARSVLRQADGKSLDGNYCTAFFTSISLVHATKAPIIDSRSNVRRSLVGLHRHGLSRDYSPRGPGLYDSPSRPWLAISTLTRIFRATAIKRLGSRTVTPHIQPYDIYGVYLGLVLHIEVGDRSDEAQWQDELQQLTMYLCELQKKWKIAGRF